MNWKYRIGFFVTIIVLSMVVILCIQENDSSKQPLEQQMESENGFLIKDSNGYITIYNLKTNQIFEESSIKYLDLPVDLQEQIKKGYKLESEQQVYSFLENYSS